MIQFFGKNFLVSGGTSGIGFATAKSLVANGGNVIIVGRNAERLTSCADTLKQINPEARIFPLALDLTSEDSEAKLSEFLKSHQIKLSGAVLAAGAHNVKPFAISKVDHFKDLFQANFFSVLSTVKAVVKATDSEGCSVVFLSSVAAIRGGGGVAAYSSAKAALGGLMRTLSLEYASRKLRFNSILPGVVKTEMTDIFFSTLSEAQQESIVKSHPLGLGSPEDVSSAICFLLSTNSRWITGTEMIIDGGLSCHS